ncbi:serine/threonine-protein kinase [Nocardia sp. BMG111209]|uniref:serine/threonine-protein kinase n=1 Tax=Nocardia sp. BMG111209 TaxID=1160137 RepID=UPI00037CCA99|nr:serine/threonine-protein kinase [Nocardia sp. BMG111209]
MDMLGDRYEITSPIGRGGMGEVFRGRDIRLRREVAIKRIGGTLVDDEEARRRFVREARITSRLHHPGVPTVFDFDEDELYLVMELLPPDNIGTLLADREYRGLPLGWAVSITAQVCAVMTAAHDVELIHRDLKPDNLVLCPNGQVKVIDFGAAASLNQTEYSMITRGRRPPVSLHYSAPELLDGAPSSRANDLYSIGVLLFELLSGRRPFDSGKLTDGFLADRTARPPIPGIPADLLRLTHNLLAVDPAQRPADTRTALRTLAAFAGPVPPLPGWAHPGPADDPVRLYVDALPSPA